VAGKEKAWYTAPRPRTLEGNHWGWGIVLQSSFAPIDQAALCLPQIIVCYFTPFWGDCRNMDLRFWWTARAGRIIFFSLFAVMQ